MTPKSTVYLLASCVAFIATVGTIFELASGQPDLGQAPTWAILILSIPTGIGLFWAAARSAQSPPS